MGVVRAKMVVLKLERVHGQDGGTVRLSPVTGYGGGENKTFWKYTPSGTFEFNSVNPDVFDAFTLGQEFYVDMTPVPMLVTLKNRLDEVEGGLDQMRQVANSNPGTPYYAENLQRAEKEAATLRDRIRDLEARGAA